MESRYGANPFLEEDDVPTISISSEPATVQVPAVTTRVSYEDIAKQLINDSFILTALELHTELQEIGKPVGFLKGYFSNPGNFERTKPPDVQSTSPPVGLQRSGSIQTFDSLDWARYSDDGDRQAEDRVAGLEFELRKAQDTIKSLRKALTIATENSGSSEVDNEKVKGANPSADLSADVIKPHERRAINFLVNEYLLLHDYKLTSVTFAEENENQDFEHWDDVGLNISKPPDLLHLYLDFGKHTGPVTNTCDVSTCDDFYLHQVAELQERLQSLEETIEVKRSDITSVNMDNQSLTTEIELLKLERSSLQDRLEEKTAECESLTANLGSQATYGDMADSHTHYQSTRELYSYQPVDRDIPPPFLHHILSMSFHAPEDNRIAQQVSRIDGNDTQSIVDMIARCLPHIVPNVLLAKREELLPLILCAANLHQSVKARDSMLNNLFNLIKKPDKLQRQMILTGCVMFAQYNGPSRVEEELLSQCWEQIGDKHMERRLLVVDACCALIPFISSSMRGSLVLSMLQQMLLDERVDEVRAAIVKSLGILVSFVDDSDKFPQLLTLYTRHALPDQSAEVQDEAVNVLLPALALWAVHIDQLVDITDLLFNSLQNSLTEPNEDNEIKVVPESFLPVMRHLHGLINYQYVSMLYSGPYMDSVEVCDSRDFALNQEATPSLDNLFTLIPDRKRYRQLWTRFHEHTSEEWYKTWDQFDLLVYATFSRLSMLALSVQTDDRRVIASLVNYVRAICVIIGQRITTDKIEPKLSDLFNYEERITPQHHKVFSSALLPMYICGVKAAFTNEADVAALTECLCQHVVAISESEVNTSSLDMAVILLLEEAALTEKVLDSLLELLMSSPSSVRITCSHLLEVSARCSPCSTLINSKILPGLVTLACDTDSKVLIATISAFGSVLVLSPDREAVDRIHSEFNKLIHQADRSRDTGMLLELIATFSRIGPNIEPQFREEVVLSHLSRWSQENNHCGDTVRRKDVALSLIDAYCALSCCFISNGVLKELFIPGIKALHDDLKQLALDGTAVIQSMIRDMEAKTGQDNSRSAIHAQLSVPGNASSPGSPSPSRNTNRSVLNKFMEKSAPTKMTTIFSKRK